MDDFKRKNEFKKNPTKTSSSTVCHCSKKIKMVLSEMHQLLLGYIISLIAIVIFASMFIFMLFKSKRIQKNSSKKQHSGVLLLDERTEIRMLDDQGHDRSVKIDHEGIREEIPCVEYAIEPTQKLNFDKK